MTCGQWDDFITAIRGPDAPRRAITGKVSWNGRILGPLVGPTFIGQMHAIEARYDKLYWDDIAGEMEYSPDDFHLTKTTVRRGAHIRRIDLALQLDKDWGFVAESPWSLTSRIDHAPSDDLQEIFEHALSVERLPHRQRSTAAAPARSPVFDSDFMFDDIQSRQVSFRPAHRAAPRGTERDPSLPRRTAQGIANALPETFCIIRSENDAVFDVSGTGVSLENIPEIQTASLPIGGTLDFTLRGSGPLRAPVRRSHLARGEFEAGNRSAGKLQRRAVLGWPKSAPHARV